MSEIREIGLERECWLLRDRQIMEPSKYGFNFCSDEMGFLLEERSFPSKNLEPLIMTLEMQHIMMKHRASLLGMEISYEPYRFMDKEFVDYITKAYKILEFTDYTKNIYGTKQTHHLGIIPESITKSPITGDMLYRLTAGVHVHFSKRDLKTGEALDLPVDYIVKQMDEAFKEDIERTKRIAGEWEPKKNGRFEYRSLPCDVDVIRVVKEAFRILRSV